MLRGQDLERAGVRIAVQYLALQIAALDTIVIQDGQVANAGGGEIKGRRRTESARADQRHAALTQARLAGFPNLR